MPCLVTTLTRSHTIKKTMGEKKQQSKQKQKRNIILKAPNNNVKIQSEKTYLYYTNLFFVTKMQMAFCFHEIR